MTESPLSAPVDSSLSKTRSLSEAARKAGRFLALGWQLNYDRAVLSLQRDILSGRFGRPLRLRCLHAMRRGRNYYGRSAWAGRITADGREVLDSPFMNACAHHFQLMTFLLDERLGEGAKVEGELYRGNPDVENYDIAALRFLTADGVSLCYYTAHPLQTKHLGQDGLGEFEHGTLTWGRGRPFRVVTDTGEVIEYGMDGGTPLMQKLYDAVQCCRDGIEQIGRAHV